MKTVTWLSLLIYTTSLSAVERELPDCLNNYSITRWLFSGTVSIHGSIGGINSCRTFAFGYGITWNNTVLYWNSLQRQLDYNQRPINIATIWDHGLLRYVNSDNNSGFFGCSVSPIVLYTGNKYADSSISDISMRLSPVVGFAWGRHSFWQINTELHMDTLYIRNPQPGYPSGIVWAPYVSISLWFNGK